jgi:hypothetical protein
VTTLKLPLFHGVKSAPEWLLKVLVKGALDNGWDPVGLVGSIALESQFDPHARASGSSAVGLGQWTDDTLRFLLKGPPRADGEGPSFSNKVVQWSAKEQLPLIWNFFYRKGVELQGADYRVMGFGLPYDAPPDAVIGDAYAPPGSLLHSIYFAHEILDTNRDGFFNVEDVRNNWAESLREAEQRGFREIDLALAPVVPEEHSGEAGGGSGVALAAMGAFALLLLLRRR